MTSGPRKVLGGLLWFGSLVLLDQVSKALSDTPWLNSEGALLKLGQSNTSSILLATATLILLLQVTVRGFWSPLFATHPTSSRRVNYQLITILAGGISNLIDRLVWGGVRDIFTLGTLFFNMADMYIVIGIIMLILSLVMEQHNKNDQAPVGSDRSN